MERETRHQLLVYHGRFLLVGALFAALITLVDQALGIGKGDWFSFENVLTYLAWSAVAIDAVLTTIVVLVLARSRGHVVAINFGLPIALMMGLLALSASHQRPVPQSDEAIRLGSRCIGGLASWSWTEPDSQSVALHLELTMPRSNNVWLHAGAAPCETREDRRTLPRGRSTWDVTLKRLDPGRPDSWSFSFKCADPEIEVVYSQNDDRDFEVYRPLIPAASSASEPAIAETDYDLFFWRNEAAAPHHKFLIRRARHAPLNEALEGDQARPIRELPARLASLEGASVTWWPQPFWPDLEEIRAVQNRFDAAGVRLIRGGGISEPGTRSADSGGAGGAADDW